MGELLPRLHEVDSYSLSGWAEGKVTVSKHDGNLQDQNETETGVFLFFEDSDTFSRTVICSFYNLTSFLLVQALLQTSLKYRNGTHKNLSRLLGNAFWKEKEPARRTRAGDWIDNGCHRGMPL